VRPAGSGLTPHQARAARAPGSAAVTAGAGTGKTHMLTERYLHHLTEGGLRPLQIVAATFTERAAAELRGRIRGRLRGEPELAHLAAELEAAQIGTLHSLAGRICREHPDSAGVPYDFTLQDELGSRLWLDRRFRAALATLPPRLVRCIPFKTLSATLRALLADPFTAERALAADPDAWPELIEAERRRIFGRISRTRAWQEAVAVMQGHPGPAGDKMELQRSAALAAIAELEAGRFTAEACRALDSLHKGRGSAAAWGADALTLLKTACGTLRECYRSGKYAFETRPGPADEALLRALPDLREAYRLVREQLAAAKRSERTLDFNDLELHALRALEDGEVRRFYRDRWKAFLVDEFQDTNPVQAELLARLTEQARLTVVGDEKQSIYGFRRADVAVFRRVRGEIEAEGGEVIELATSFRTHAGLIEPLNGAVRPGLAELHQPLAAARVEAPGDGPYLSLHLMAGNDSLKQFRQRAEAHLVGQLIEDLLNAGTPVHDKLTGSLRPVRPGDIALLARTWDTLGPYGDELAARGIATIHAGGGSLLAQREAKDAIALLRFLADPHDTLALAAVLRSPFFAIADRELLRLAGRLRGGDTSWWQLLSAPEFVASTSLAFAGETLARLLSLRAAAPPSALLACADEFTGYTAVIANLPGGPRRLADWRGFVDLVRALEQGHADVFALVRELTALLRLEETKVPRPGMEAGDAVSLMSVHNAKGLEWPVVILPDITAGGAGRGAEVVFEADAGVAFKLRDAAGQELEPVLYTLLNARRKEREADEAVRVQYVALTRARDRVIITGNEEKGGWLEDLREGLSTAGVEPRLVPFDPAHAVPKTPLPQAVELRDERLLSPLGPGLSELPVTSLSTYSVCPKRFRFQHLLQHPGAGEGGRTARRVGVLSHIALERDIRDADALGRFDRTLEPAHVRRALELANAFRTDPRFQTVRESIEGREQRVTTELAGIRLHGVVDAVGDGFVLDYKTGEPGEGDGHLLAHGLQVAVYARALARERAHVAYLAVGELRSFEPAELRKAVESAEGILASIAAGDFTATPTLERCGRCPFESICDDSALD
jgi:ATP-dependent helicase/nuclease subunit A